MKKYILTAIAAAVSIIMCTGCSANEIEYDANLGYDFNNVKSGDVVFNVYHSDTEDHLWELIASFPCRPEPEHYNDVRLECEGDQITAELTDNTYTKSDDGTSAAYDSTVISSYGFTVEGFKGSLSGYGFYSLKNKSGEQPVRLYPVSNNEDVSLVREVDPDKPYDTEGENLDNILVTVVIN